MKHQTLFSLEDKSKKNKIKVPSAAISLGPWLHRALALLSAIGLRVKKCVVASH